MNFLGIDPGVKGGYAILSGHSVIGLGGLPRIGRCWDGGRLLPLIEQVDVVILERVNCGATPSRLSAFSFGEGYGYLQGLVHGRKRLELVPPKEWQKEMLAGIKGDNTKKRALVAAIRLWPSEEAIIRELKDGPVDALLIAEWGRRNRQ